MMTGNGEMTGNCKKIITIILKMLLIKISTNLAYNGEKGVWIFARKVLRPQWRVFLLFIPQKYGHNRNTDFFY